MLFVDLDQLKIIKSYQFETKSKDINIDINDSLINISQSFFEAANSMLNNDVPPAIECSYQFNIISDETVSTNEEAEIFITIVNAGIAQFFRALTTAEKRKREYRLDVSQNLKCLKMNLSPLKKAINYRTVVEKFNIEIRYKDLIYILCDDKDIEIQPFIHTEDVLDA